MEEDDAPSTAPLPQVPAAGAEETLTVAAREGRGTDTHASTPHPLLHGTCPPEYWSCPGHAGLKVRGARYFKVSPCFICHIVLGLRTILPSGSSSAL